MLTFFLALQLSLSPKVVSKPLPAKTIRNTSDNIIVIHYDSSPDVNTTIRYLKKKRDAYHFIIDRNGVIYKLIDPKYEARHAGVSFFRGHFQINKFSIGICLSTRNPKESYTDAQYKSLAWLIRQQVQRYPDITDDKIVGHSDVAIPFLRKKDPGKSFDWTRLFSLIHGRKHLNE